MKTDKKDILNRLKRTEGQLRGIQKMLEEDKECIDIINQLSAVRSSINSTMGIVIANKLKEALNSKEYNSKLQEENIEAAIKLILKK